MRLAPSLLALALFASSGCVINETPELEDFKLSAATAKRGETVNGTAMVEDDDGDLSGGKMVVTLRSGDKEDARELPIELGSSVGKAAISVSLQVSALAPVGPATVDLQVFDKAGHGSNVQSASLVIE
jgi:hypothetical protein